MNNNNNNNNNKQEMALLSSRSRQPWKAFLQNPRFPRLLSPLTPTRLSFLLGFPIKPSGSDFPDWHYLQLPCIHTSNNLLPHPLLLS